MYNYREQQTKVTPDQISEYQVPGLHGPNSEFTKFILGFRQKGFVRGHFNSAAFGQSLDKDALREEVTAAASSLPFWEGLVKDIQSYIPAETGSITIGTFYERYHPQKAPNAENPFVIGKYSLYESAFRYAQIGKGLDEFLSFDFSPPQDNPYFQQIVRTSRRLMFRFRDDMPGNKTRMRRHEALLQDPDFWEYIDPIVKAAEINGKSQGEVLDAVNEKFRADYQIPVFTSPLYDKASGFDLAAYFHTTAKAKLREEGIANPPIHTINPKVVQLFSERRKATLGETPHNTTPSESQAQQKEAPRQEVAVFEQGVQQAKAPAQTPKSEETPAAEAAIPQPEPPQPEEAPQVPEWLAKLFPDMKLEEAQKLRQIDRDMIAILLKERWRIPKTPDFLKRFAAFVQTATTDLTGTTALDPILYVTDEFATQGYQTLFHHMKNPKFDNIYKVGKTLHDITASREKLPKGVIKRGRPRKDKLDTTWDQINSSEE